MVSAWVRDAGGGSELITGEDTDEIYALAGQWRMDRRRRDIPAIATCLCRIGGAHFTFSYGMVPEHLVLPDRRGEPRSRVESSPSRPAGKSTWRVWNFKALD